MKKEAMEVLRNRRSIRQYKDTQVSKEDLNTMLELGTYAPTSRGLQLPMIVAVQDKDTVAQLAKLNASFLEREGNPYHGAPTIVIVFSPGDSRTCVEDGSAVMTQLLVAAYAVGLGACWINREKQMFDTEEGKALMKKWGVPENFVGVGGFSLGYADGEHPEPIARKEDYIIIV